VAEVRGGYDAVQAGPLPSRHGAADRVAGRGGAGPGGHAAIAGRELPRHGAAVLPAQGPLDHTAAAAGGDLMRVLISGASGFLGANFLAHLLDTTPDWSFVCPYTFSHRGVPERIENVLGSLTDTRMRKIVS